MFKIHKKSSFFSHDYFEARQKFLRLSQNASAYTAHFLCPDLGPKYKKIYTDVSYLGRRDAKKIIILNSGTHGIEGFCGSAIQCKILQEHETYLKKGNFAILLIHALNPYGFSWLRRTNENNIDLNRNFLENFQSLPSNDLYKKLYPSLCPPQWRGKKVSFYDLKLLYFLRIHGSQKMQQAISQGQYEFPKGLFYGGYEPSWSYRTLETILNGFTKLAHHIICTDIHTGLGAFGVKELIAPYRKNDPQFAMCQEAFKNDNITFCAEGSSSSAPISGDVDQAVHFFLKDKNILAYTLEYGTYPTDKVLEVLRAENWLEFYGDPKSQTGKKIKRNFKETFFPNNIEWQEKILHQGKEVMNKNIELILKASFFN